MRFKLKWILFRLLFLLCLLIFACGRIPSFDGEGAFRYLEEQCNFGPRYPGSIGHEKVKDYLISELKSSGAILDEQDFNFYDTEKETTLVLTNIIASFFPEKSRRILLAAHWDTRPFADREPLVENRKKPILGANDGASGVAVLLQLAKILCKHNPKVGVDIVFFDGEDYGQEGKIDDYLLGSKYFAQHLRGSPRGFIPSGYQPQFGVVIDMIGDADQQIYQERYSLEHSPEIIAKVWEKAKRLGFREFKPEVKYAIIDDHLPLISAGIKCIDIIDFDYPFWHTLQDTPDKCSSASLERVGTLLVYLIYK
ncbi:MAG: M28 family peptidase [Candidatus Edwardsbacteria bacterium]